MRDFSKGMSLVANGVEGRNLREARIDTATNAKPRGHDGTSFRERYTDSRSRCRAPKRAKAVGYTEIKASTHRLLADYESQKTSQRLAETR